MCNKCNKRALKDKRLYINRPCVIYRSGLLNLKHLNIHPFAIFTRLPNWPVSNRQYAYLLSLPRS